MTAGFGLEKLGLVTLRFPRTTLLIVAALAVVFIFGATRVGFSSDIREIFRSGSADFAALQEVERQYPGSERDILIVVEGEGLFEKPKLEALRTVHLELGLMENVGSVLSIFSARKPPDAQGNAATLIPPDLSRVEDMEALRERVRNDPLVAGRLLSPDGDLALIALSLSGENHDIDYLRRQIGEVEDITGEFLQDTNLDFTLTGSSVMRVEIIGALIQDQRTFRLLGLVVATLICWLFFRSIPYVVIALAPAGLAIIGLRGGMGLAGQDINVLTNVIPSLVMVIAFASALHLLFAIRRKLGGEAALETAIREAVVEVGPACVLTSATTAIALMALMVVPHPFIAGFGLTAALGTAFAYVAIMLMVPPLSRLLLGRFGVDAAERNGGTDPVQRGLDWLSGRAAGVVRASPGAVALIGLAIALAAGALYALNEPQYQYKDNLPRDNAAYQAIETVNSKLSGTDTLRLLIEFSDEHAFRSPETLEVIRSAHEILAAEPAIESVGSLTNFETWFTEGGLGRSDLFTFLTQADSPLVRRVIAPEHNSALLTGYFGSLPAAEMVAVLDRLKQRLGELQQRHESVRFSLTGLVPVSAKASTEMIGQLNQSLLGAVAVIILLIGVAFRSVWSGMVSILPNLLPVMVAGASLYLTGMGLQFTSVVAFTIGFGIAVDNTIHILNRYRLARREEAGTADALDATIRAIGPVLVMSTLVLVAGIGGTMFSGLPMVRLYGYMIALLLTTALVGNLLFLPAIIRVTEDWRRVKRADGGETETERAAEKTE